MAGTIFWKKENGELLELCEMPYDSENVFQELIEKNPKILAGDQIDPNDPCRWVLLSREMGIPSAVNGGNQWFLDHLFVDHKGIPTLVEVKRSTDTRIRREVVGQMLEYAANATEYWNVEDLERLYEASGRTLANELGFDEEQQEDFWENVKNNLKSGKIRLLFVADTIPQTLLRMIEFLNDQMTNTEVLGLEIKQYRSGNDRQLFVPRIVGRTVQGAEVKRAGNIRWDADSFLGEVERVGGAEIRNRAERIMKDFSAMGCRVRFGRGYTHSSIVLIYDGKFKKVQLISVYPWTKGVYFEIDFQHFKEPFDTLESRRLLREDFEKALGVSIAETKLNSHPTFPLGVLLDEQKYAGFKKIFQDMIERIKAAENS